MSLSRRCRPWLAQVPSARPDHFEGWYYKFTTSGGRSCALIPGLSTARHDPHSFIQYIDGASGRTAYFRFPLQDYATRDDPFEVRIAGHRFTASEVVLDTLRSPDHSLTMEGRVVLGPWTPYPAGFLRPGIMGPFGLFGFLECYHGVVSSGHSLQGSLHLGLDGVQETWDLEGGKGYIEKDWGTSFPKDYLWLQANQFAEPELSVFASLAAIPFRGFDFPGLIAFVYEPGGGYHTFATWNGAKVRRAAITATTCHLVLSRGSLTLEIHGRQTAAGSLQAPAGGRMDRVIKESVDGVVDFALTRGTRVIAEGTSAGAGLEQGGNPRVLESWFLTGRRPPRAPGD